MKIAIILSSRMMLGFILDLVLEGAKRGCQIDIFVPEKSVVLNKELEEQILKTGACCIKHIKLARKISFSDISLPLQVFKLKNYDQVISMGPKSLLLNYLSKVTKISHCSIHIVTGQRWATLTGVTRRFFIFLDKILLGRMNKVICDSPSQVRILSKLGICKNASSIDTGSIKGIYIRDGLTQKRPEIYNFDNGNIVIGYLGRLNKDKGLEDLESFILSDEAHKFNFLIAGPKENFDFKPHVKVLKNFKQYDFISNVDAFYRSIDVFVLPTHREGFGSVVLEANAYGIPVVGRYTYGLNDSLKNNVNGIFFGKRDDSGLSKVVNELVSHEKRQRIGQLARTRIKKHYNPVVVAKKYADLLKW